jgi:hypothetical protein
MNAVGTIALSADDVAKLCADNLRMRDKLLALAKECASCGGLGTVAVMRYAGDPLYFEGGKVERVEPCGDCADIREALL